MEFVDFKINKEKIETQKALNVLACTDELSDKQRATLKKYFAHLNMKGLSVVTRANKLYQAKWLLQDFGKDLSEITMKDIEDYLILLSTKTKGKKNQKLSDSTIQLRREFLVHFLEWHYGKKKADIPLIADVEVKRRNKIKLPEEIYSPAEMKRMIQVADSFRDKALISILYESGGRVGEFLQLKIKHVELNPNGYAMLHLPKGKTIARKIPLIYSMPHLRNWLNSHPNREHQNAPLFPNRFPPFNKGFSIAAINDLLSRTARRAEIKKNVSAHLLRHSRITELAKSLTESELRIFAGWTADSSMPKVYVHLSGKDVQNKLLQNAGLLDIVETEKNNETLTTIQCPRCEYLNPCDNKYCKCGFVLDLKEANNMLDQEKSTFKAKEALVSFFSRPENMEMLMVHMRKAKPLPVQR